MQTQKPNVAKILAAYTKAPQFYSLEKKCICMSEKRKGTILILDYKEQLKI